MKLSMFSQYLCIRGQLSKQEVHVYAALLIRIVEEFLLGAEMEREREKERVRD